jgi:hypothetical protein
MRSLLLQITALTLMNLRSVPKRFWLSLSTVIAVMLVVVVLLAFLAMRNGFRQTLASAGAEDVAIVLRAGSQSELASVVTRDQVQLIEEAPGIVKSPDGKPLVSAELYLVVDGIKHSSQTKANLPLRGIGREGMAARKGITMIAGRMFSPGSNEIIVGRALLDEFDGLELGRTVTFGTGRWTVVGVFEAEGSVFESEIWADLPVVQSTPCRSAGARWASAIPRQRSPPQARSEVGSRVFRRAGLRDIRPDPEARLAAGDSDGVRRARRCTQHDVFVRRSAYDRDRNFASDRVRRSAGLCRHTRRIRGSRLARRRSRSHSRVSDL